MRMSLDKIAERLQAEGFDARVEMTGGGVATLYGGPSSLDVELVPRYAVVVGPGWFEPHWSAPGAKAFIDEDACFGPDDEGESMPIYAAHDEDEKAFGDRILAYLREKAPTA